VNGFEKLSNLEVKELVQKYVTSYTIKKWDRFSVSFVSFLE
jgi:hypothetical protein